VYATERILAEAEAMGTALIGSGRATPQRSRAAARRPSR